MRKVDEADLQSDIQRSKIQPRDVWGNCNGITVTKIFRIRGFSSSFHEVESR